MHITFADLYDALRLQWRSVTAAVMMRRLPRRKDSGRFQSCLVAESFLTKTLLICFPSSPMTEE